MTITVFDQPDISGSYLVEPMGTITLPLVGPIDVTAFTPEALQGDLTARLASGYLQNPVVSVRLSELRPVTIVGGVMAPGRYAYIDGMTTETAMAVAGGLSRLTDEGVAQRSDFLQTDERLKSLRIAYLAELARKARLDAQLAGSDVLELPVVDPQDAAMMALLVAGEREILAFQSTSQTRQMDLLGEQSHQVEGDIAAFTEQSDLEKEQIAYLDDQIGDFQRLLNSGLTRKSSVIDLQREKSKSRSDLSRILSDLSRSRSTLAEARLKLAELDTSYRSRLMTDLQETRLKLADAESGLPLVTEARRIKLDQMPLAARDPAAAVALRISRYRDGRLSVFDADASTPIRPGDILHVGSPLQGEGAPPAPIDSLALPPSGDAAGAFAPLARAAGQEPDRLSRR